MPGKKNAKRMFYGHITLRMFNSSLISLYCIIPSFFSHTQSLSLFLHLLSFFPLIHLLTPYLSLLIHYLSHSPPTYLLPPYPSLLIHSLSISLLALILPPSPLLCIFSFYSIPSPLSRIFSFYSLRSLGLPILTFILPLYPSLPLSITRPLFFSLPIYLLSLPIILGTRGDCGYPTVAISSCPGLITCSSHGQCLSSPTYACACSAGTYVRTIFMRCISIFIYLFIFFVLTFSISFDVFLYPTPFFFFFTILLPLLHLINLFIYSYLPSNIRMDRI